MNLPVLPAAQLLRDRPAEGQPADPADRLAVRRRDDLRRAAAQPGRHDRPRPARRRRAATPRSGACSAARRRRPSPPSGSSSWSRSWSTRRSSAPIPNRTIIPGLIVDAVVVEPCGAHPSYAQGYYDRDNQFYLDWDAISRDEARLEAWLDEWVHGVDGRAEYLDKLGAEPRSRRSAGLARHPARSTTASTGDATPAFSQLRDDDRGRGARAGRPARLLRRRRPAQHRGQPGQADRRARPRAGLRGRRLRRPAGAPAAVASATRPSSPARRP